MRKHMPQEGFGNFKRNQQQGLLPGLPGTSGGLQSLRHVLHYVSGCGHNDHGNRSRYGRSGKIEGNIWVKC